MAEICGILLAAGFSRRFGANKMLHRLPDGTPIAVAAARNLLLAMPRTVAVVRPGAKRLAQLLRETGCKVVTSRNARSGMGASLASGVRASGDAHGWVVALADMPFIRPATIRLVVDEIEEGGAIVAASRAGVRGHPVGFARRFREDLLGLTGDEGARELLREHPDWITLLETDDPGALQDIDTPEDLNSHPAVLAAPCQMAAASGARRRRSAQPRKRR